MGQISRCHGRSPGSRSGDAISSASSWYCCLVVAGMKGSMVPKDLLLETSRCLSFVAGCDATFEVCSGKAANKISPVAE
jgi:hypothetical protein